MRALREKEAADSWELVHSQLDNKRIRRNSTQPGQRVKHLTNSRTFPDNNTQDIRDRNPRGGNLRSKTLNAFPQDQEQDEGQSAVCFPFSAALETLAKASQQEMFMS